MFSLASSPVMLQLLGWIPIDVEDRGGKTCPPVGIALCQTGSEQLSKNSITKVADIWHPYICYFPLSKTDMSIISSSVVVHQGYVQYSFRVEHHAYTWW